MHRANNPIGQELNGRVPMMWAMCKAIETLTFPQELIPWGSVSYSTYWSSWKFYMMIDNGQIGDYGSFYEYMYARWKEAIVRANFAEKNMLENL